MGEANCKLSFNSESMWFENLHDGQYRVCNIPFNEQNFCINDIIDVDGNVIKRNTRLKVANYDCNKENIKDIYKDMFMYLEKNQIQVEGLVAGLVALAIPMSMTDAKSYEIIKASPIKLDILHEQQVEIPLSSD